MYAMIPAEALLIRFTVAAALFLDLSESLVGRGVLLVSSFPFFLLMFLGLVFCLGFSGFGFPGFGSWFEF